MADRSLILNGDFTPIGVVSLRRAVILVLAGKADVVEEGERQIRSAYAAIGAPLVVKLRRYVRVPFRATVPLSRRAVLARDGHVCAYGCGRRATTIDHVVPRSRGGAHEWGNVAACCGPDNHRKGNRTPAEAGMTLGIKPRTPTGTFALVVLVGSVDPSWAPYLGDVPAASLAVA